MASIWFRPQYDSIMYWVSDSPILCLWCEIVGFLNAWNANYSCTLVGWLSHTVNAMDVDERYVAPGHPQWRYIYKQDLIKLDMSTARRRL